MTRAAGPPSRRHRRARRTAAWLAGILLVLGLLAWLLQGFDFGRFRAALAASRWSFDVVLLAAVLLEQLLRAWKWRQVMWPSGRVPTLRLLGAILASYLPGLAVGMGPGLVIRAWLVARRSGLRTAAVLATLVVDRLADGLAFLLVVAVTLATAAVPAASPRLHTGVAVGAGLSAGLIALGIALLVWHRRRALARALPLAGLRRLSPQLAARLEELSRVFAAGTAWPAGLARNAGIAATALVIKALAVSDMLWATLATGVLLKPTDYLVVMVFLSSVTVLGFFIRLPGGMLLAAAFVLNLFGVAKEPALLAAAMMEGVFLFVFVVFGALALLLNGVRLSALARVAAEARDSAQQGDVHAPGVDQR